MSMQDANGRLEKAKLTKTNDNKMKLANKRNCTKSPRSSSCATRLHEANAREARVARQEEACAEEHHEMCHRTLAPRIVSRAQYDDNYDAHEDNENLQAQPPSPLQELRHTRQNQGQEHFGKLKFTMPSSRRAPTLKTTSNEAWDEMKLTRGQVFYQRIKIPFSKSFKRRKGCPS